jgi:hypothetical protein
MAGVALSDKLGFFLLPWARASRALAGKSSNALKARIAV